MRTSPASLDPLQVQDVEREVSFLTSFFPGNIFIARFKMRDALSHRCDITGKTIADRAKNTEGYIPIPALHASKITPVQSALHGEILLTKAQELPRSPETPSKC
jgi:hypothetical protein